MAQGLLLVQGDQEDQMFLIHMLLLVLEVEGHIREMDLALIQVEEVEQQLGSLLDQVEQRSNRLCCRTRRQNQGECAL